MTFTGSFDFLDSSASFNAIFGIDPTMLRLTPRKKDQCATDLNMLERISMTRRKCLRIFFLHFRNLKWFLPFMVKIFFLHLKNCSVDLPYFFLYSHPMPYHGHSV